MPTLPRVACLAVVIAVAVSALRAQEPTRPAGPTFRGGVDVVQIDVSVLGRDRRPVRGLTAADFTILEDGKPVPLTSFTPVEVPALVQPAAAWMRDIAPDVVRNDIPAERIVTIVIDDANTGIGDAGWDPWIRREGLRIARGFVDSLGPTDQAAVVFTFMGRPQNFTSDRAKLLKAIESYTPKESPTAGPPLACRSRGNSGCVLDTLRSVAQSLPNAPPRRKVVVFISQGRGVPELDVDNFQPNTLGQMPMLSEVREMFAAFQRANATIYAFSPRGLSVQNARGDSDRLRTFAEHTGGRAIVDTNDPAAQVTAVLEETSAYYLLAFPSVHSDGKFRKLQVKVNRPDVDVRARTGYLAPGAAQEAPRRAERPVPAIDQALASPYPVSTVPLTVHAAAVPMPGQREADVAITTSIRTELAGGTEARQFTVVTTAYDKDWKARGSHRQVVSVTPTARGGSATLEVRSPLRLKPGRYEVRVAVDNDVNTGSAAVDVDVPDVRRDRLSMSEPILGDARVSSGFEGLPVMPTVRRVFAPTSRVELFVRLAQGGSRPLESALVSWSIKDVASRTVAEGRIPFGPTRFGDERTGDLLTTLPLASLPAGDYLLTVEGALDEERIVRHARFTVQP